MSDTEPPSETGSAAGADKVVRVERVIAASPEAIFAVLADPNRHQDFDGSGTVRAARSDAPERLTLGSRFGMNMRLGVPYRTTNEVVEFDEGRLIGWRHVGGHVWRYRLEAVEGAEPPATLVVEEFDWSTNRAPLMLKVMKAIPKNEKAMRATLERLASLVEPAGT
jgi:uncharacterized protein YndB with AHSA1/START domain